MKNKYKNYLKSFTVVLFISITTSIYFNATTNHNFGQTSSHNTEPIGIFNNEDINLFDSLSDKVSFHLGDTGKINLFLNSHIRDEYITPLIQGMDFFSSRQNLYSNELLDEISWGAVPRCSLSDRGQAELKIYLRNVFFDAQLNPNSPVVHLGLSESYENTLNVSVNLSNARVHGALVVEYWRCGELKKIWKLGGNFTGLIFSATAGFSFQNGAYLFNGVQDAHFDYFGVPFFYDYSLGNVSWALNKIAQFTSEICTQISCFQNFLFSYIEQKLDINETLETIINDGVLIPLQNTLTEILSIAGNAIPTSPNIQIENIKMGGNEGFGVLTSIDMDLSSQNTNCTTELELSQGNPEIFLFERTHGPGPSIKLGLNIIEGFIYHFLKTGILCFSNNIQNIAINGQNYNISASISPSGQLDITKGTYQYESITENYSNQEPTDIPRPNSGMGRSIPGNQGGENIQQSDVVVGGVDDAIDTLVPIELSLIGTSSNSSLNFSTIVNGTISLKTMLQTSLDSFGNNAGLGLAIKEISMNLESLTANTPAGSLNLSPIIQSFNQNLFSNFKETRVNRVEVINCPQKDPNIWEQTNDTYTRNTTFIRNCPNCLFQPGLNFQLIGENSSDLHIQNYYFGENDSVIIGFGDKPYGYEEISSQNDCEQPDLLSDQRERLEDTFNNIHGRQNRDSDLNQQNSNSAPEIQMR